MSDFASGIRSMARSSKAAVSLVRSGKWTLDDFDRWLDSVIKSDPNYIKEADSYIMERLKEAHDG